MKKNKFFKEDLQQSLEIERFKRTIENEINYIINELIRIIHEKSNL